MSLQIPIRRMLAGLLLPFSLVPVVLLSPSLLRGPVVLWRHANAALAPAHPHPQPLFAAHYLLGPSRVEIDALEEYAGPFTPKNDVSPLAEPAWAAAAANAGTSLAAVPVRVYREVEVAAAPTALAPVRPRTSARRLGGGGARSTHARPPRRRQ